MQEIDPAEFFREFRLVCCADPRWAGCPHPIDEHRADGACRTAGCSCTGLLRHTDGCVHNTPAEQG